MDDSDEYFDESFILDEAALASIQATEERFGASLSQPRRSQPAPLLHVSPSSPPSKRLKTSHGPVGHGVARVSPQPFRTMEGLDLNPEIRVDPEGNYVVGTQSKALTRSGGLTSGLGERLSAKLNCSTVPGGGGLVSEAAIHRSTSHTAVVPPEDRPMTQRFSHLHDNQQHHSSYSRPTLSQEPPRHQTQTLDQNQSLVRPTITFVHSADEWIPSTASQRRARIIEQALAEAARSQAPTPTTTRDTAQPDSVDIHTELASVRAQLATLNAENAAIQKSLRVAHDAQLVKAGEVSILRQAIDKANKEHAEAIAKAKADMIAHEKLKFELQAKLKEETERMATRLVFQQHEMETSTRKPPWNSTRSLRIAKDPSMSASAFAITPTRAQGPFPPPSISHPARRVSLGHCHEDHQGGGIAPLSSPTNECKPTRSGEDAKQPRFKGFHNAFTDAEPILAQSMVSEKGGNIEENQRDPFLTPMKPNEFQDVDSRSSGNGEWKEKGSEVDDDLQTDWWESDSLGREVGYRKAMIANDQEDGRAFLMEPGTISGEEDMAIEEGVDWGEELRRIVFTHIAPRNDVLTLHILLSTVIPPEATSGERNAYMTACQVILESCGTRHGSIQYSNDSKCEANCVIHKVANAFVIVCDILARTGCVTPLTALLDLLFLLTLNIPAFSSPLLGPPTAKTLVSPLDSDNPSELLCMLCDVVRVHLAPPKLNLNVTEDTNGNENMRAALAMAVVQLMESLCWTVKDHLGDQLGVLPHQPLVFEILLDPAQAPELIARTLQLLVLLATCSNDQASLLMRDPSSLVEKLCYYLVEPVAEESYRIRHLVIILISVLADSHIETRTILLDSITLAPSLVICIAKLSKLLWEDDLGIMSTPNSAKLILDLLYSTVNLLHHLVFVLDLSTFLGRKLIEATRLPGTFNGVTHMFIVTFGRLSWAECPEWLDKDCKHKCEVIAEQAMEIIETVVAGPECDSLWAVWHQFEVTDEEELEALKIQID